ncbi:MAG TPA: coenzyme F420-0:L-glutamate ligase [Solirubrobacterales bacterium]|nr:coenzyme F420-0:L-glutamate ligase [Solirubrobacterales bacterium]
MTRRLKITPLEGLPEVRAGDRLGELIASAARANEVQLADADVLVVSQKVVSKAEGRTRRLAGVEPRERAASLAAELEKDPRLVELILAETKRIVRAERGVLIVETVQGWVCANAGIDASNVPGDDTVVLLPEDADASARRMRAELEAAASSRPAVIVADSFGRPWRLGQTDVAIGCAGIEPLDDWRGREDREGRELAATAIAVADELAAAADLTRDKAAGIPAIRIRGAAPWVTAEDGPGAASLRRAEADDLFR